MNNDRKREAALEMLNELIIEGWEYPDAEWRVACRFEVPSETIREDYDYQFTKELQNEL